MRTVIAIYVTSALISPALAQVDLDGSFPSGLDFSFAAMHSAIADKLTDPTSARYKNMQLTDQVVCGLLNSKGQAGGYGEFSPFLYDRADGDVLVITPERLEGFKGTVTDLFERVGCPLSSLGLGG